MGSWSVEIQLIVWTNRVKHISENSGVIFLLFYAHQIRLSSRWDCGNCELLRHPARHEAASYCTILITRRFCWRCCHTDDIDWNDFSISKSTQHQEITYIYTHLRMYVYACAPTIQKWTWHNEYYSYDFRGPQGRLTNIFLSLLLTGCFFLAKTFLVWGNKSRMSKL